jgi:hypothetical protein
MGFMTMDDFRTDLQSAMGDKGIDNTRLDRWINYAYLDLAGSVDFEVLDEDDTVATVAATQTIDAPDNTMIIKFIRNTTSDALLGWVPKGELFRRSSVITGPPTQWTRHGSVIYLHPVPDAVYSLFIISKIPPDLMTSGTDVTVFPDTWDAAIFFLSVHYGLLAIGEEQRSAAWMSRAVSYIQSRMTEKDLHAKAAGLGASLPGDGSITAPGGA